MRKLIAILLLVLSYAAVAQESGSYTNYHSQLIKINPAFAGVENYSELNFGYKQPFADLEGGASNNFFSYEGKIRRSNPTDFRNQGVVMSNPDYYDSIASQNQSFSQRHGIAGYVQIRKVGGYEFTEVKASYAFHLPISKKYFLSMGTWVGYLREKIDVQNLTVRDPDNDALYQQIIGTDGIENYLQLNLGLGLYSDRLYLGVSGNPVLSKSIDNENNFQNSSDLKLTALMGYKIPVSAKFDLSFDGMAFQNQNDGIGYRAQAKGIINNKVLFGTAYSDKESISILFGIKHDIFGLHYAYDMVSDTQSIYEQNTHEFVLNLRLGKFSNSNSRFW